MDKYKTIEQKITAFFNEKAEEKRVKPDQLKLIISYDGMLRYELWDTIGGFHGYRKLDEILKLNFLEKAFVSNKDVETTLLKTIERFANENQVMSKEIQLLLLPDLKYNALKQRKKIKDITLNQIL